MLSEASDIADFVARFRWTADTRDRWAVLSQPDHEGYFRGDCEDFALTTLWLMCGKSWLKLWLSVVMCRAVIWHCRWDGEGHVALWVRGHGWIDNIHPWWSEHKKHRLSFPYVAPLLALVLLLKWKR